jgi:hypothetical protein
MEKVKPQYTAKALAFFTKQNFLRSNAGSNPVFIGVKI